MARRNRGAEAADALRSAVDRTFQATVGQAGVTRERAQEVVDELAGITNRVRDVLDDLRVASGEEVRELRERIEALERRVTALERKPARSSSSTAKKRASRKKTI